MSLTNRPSDTTAPSAAAATDWSRLVVWLLLAVWVFQDIRKRNAGSGLWIVVTLLTGLLGAVLYALVRIGDKPA